MTLNKCEKCGATHIRTSYHKPGCPDRRCTCATCAYGLHEKRHDEHLHHFCQGCGFDWISDVLPPSAGEETPCS